MRATDRKYASVSKLRKRITQINHALKGCETHPTGLSRMLREDLKRELPLIRNELQNRRGTKP